MERERDRALRPRDRDLPGLPERSPGSQRAPDPRAARRGLGARVRRRPARRLPDQVKWRTLALLAGGAATLVRLAPLRADPARGEQIFQRCFACHSVVAGDDRLPDPSLRGVVGRPAGILPRFRYSPALVYARPRRLVWSPESLNG